MNLSILNGPCLKKTEWWLTAMNIEEVKERIHEKPVHITYGGWGQDGHVAYNQARRHPFSSITIDDLRNSSIRIQENNVDTIIALAQRTFGAAYQFVPPMSVTLGMKECMAVKKVRLFSDTGAWKRRKPEWLFFGPEGLLQASHHFSLCPGSSGF